MKEGRISWVPDAPLQRADVEDEVVARRMHDYGSAGSLFGSGGIMTGIRAALVERILQAELAARAKG